jgi:hypothetical protein
MISKMALLMFLLFSSFGAYASSDGGSEAHGMPGPAYMSCIGKNGLVFDAKSNFGTQSFCKLDDAVVELNTFYFGLTTEHPSSQAIHAFLSSTVSHSNGDCSLWGAHTELFYLNTNESFYTCEFPDQSMIGLETLKHGCLYARNHELRSALSGGN